MSRRAESLVGSSWRPSAARVAGFLLAALLAGHGEVHAGQLTLTWVSSAMHELLGFSIERSTGTSAAFAVVATVGSGVTAYTDFTVADATAYCYRIRAFNETAYSEYSDIACSAALDVTLSLNQTTVSNGDDLIASAHIHVKAHFANPVDGYLALQDSSGSVYPVTSYVNVNVESESADFTRVKDLGAVTGLSPGIAVARRREGWGRPSDDHGPAQQPRVDLVRGPVTTSRFPRAPRRAEQLRQHRAADRSARASPASEAGQHAVGKCVVVR